MTVEQKLTKEIDEGFVELYGLDRFSERSYALRNRISILILKRSRLTIGEAQAKAED